MRLLEKNISIRETLKTNFKYDSVVGDKQFLLNIVNILYKFKIR